MSAESNRNLAEYFERRARHAYRDRERERFLTIARTYREQAMTDRDESFADQSGHQEDSRVGPPQLAAS